VETRWSEIVAEFSDADTALQSAIEMQNRVTELPPVSGLRLTLQIGLSYGAANEQAASPFGPIVEMADNLAKLAEPGQIVASTSRTALRRSDRRCWRRWHRKNLNPESAGSAQYNHGAGSA
jgi:class 3 adenylate cyclase